MSATVFFGDILGFSALAKVPGAQPARDALSDIAKLLSQNHDVAQYLQKGAPWTSRYGLSDSVFLVAPSAEPAAIAVGQLFFNVAFYSAQATDSAVLLRGALAQGDVQAAPAIFPETAQGNLVGSAVVEAVRLEKSGPKGPRIILSESVAAALQGTRVAWLLDQQAAQPPELLWPLPLDPDAVPAEMVGDIGHAAGTLLEKAPVHPDVQIHYVAYVDLIARSLLRLRERNATAATTAWRRTDLDRVRPLIQPLVNAGQPVAVALSSRLAQLAA